MNSKQLIILWIGILILILNFLYVPFVYSENNLLKDYYFIWEPPVEVQKLDVYYYLNHPGAERKYVKFIVDLPRLTLQIGIVAVVFLGLLFTFSSKTKSKPTKENTSKPTNTGQPTEAKKKIQPSGMSRVKNFKRVEVYMMR